MQDRIEIQIQGNNPRTTEMITELVRSVLGVQNSDTQSSYVGGSPTQAAFAPTDYQAINPSIAITGNLQPLPPTVEERMAAVQAELERRGMVSFSLTLAPGAEQQPAQKLKLDLLEMIEAYLDGKCKPAGPLGDSKIAETPLRMETTLAENRIVIELETDEPGGLLPVGWPSQFAVVVVRDCQVSRYNLPAGLHSTLVFATHQFLKSQDPIALTDGSIKHLVLRIPRISR